MGAKTNYCGYCKKDYSGQTFNFCPECGHKLVDYTKSTNSLESITKCTKWRVRKLDETFIKSEGV